MREKRSVGFGHGHARRMMELGFSLRGRERERERGRRVGKIWKTHGMDRISSTGSPRFLIHHCGRRRSALSRTHLDRLRLIMGTIDGNSTKRALDRVYYYYSGVHEASFG